MTDLTRELFNARFDALEAKFQTLSVSLERENDRQDEAIERLADRSTHNSETKRLTERVQKLESLTERVQKLEGIVERVRKIESQIDAGRNSLNDLGYKVKITWGVGVALMGVFISILAAIIKGWIGV